jgi:hypothetical protein
MNLKVTSRVARWSWLLFLPRFGCSRLHLSGRNILFLILVSVLFLFVSVIQNANALQLNSDSTLATAGYYQLRWSGHVNNFQLQESRTTDFKIYKILYEGKDLARFVSGKSDGDFFYRVTALENNPVFSNVIKVTVFHHPLENAILFFIAGAIVFISILILIIKGNKEAES